MKTKSPARPDLGTQLNDVILKPSLAPTDAAELSFLPDYLYNLSCQVCEDLHISAAEYLTGVTAFYLRTLSRGVVAEILDKQIQRFESLTHKNESCSAAEWV